MRTQNIQYTRRTSGKRLAINENYAEQQLAKRALKGDFEIKEGNMSEAALIKLRQHLENVLEFNNITINCEAMLDLIKEFKFTPLADIKEHLVIKAYYQIEDLHKYMIR